MKRTVLVFLMLILSISFIWCTGKKEEKNVTLKYWTWYPAAEVIQPVLAEFEKTHPGVTVELTVMESTVYQEKLPLALASGEDLDVFGVQTGQMPTNIKGYMEPIEKQLSSAAGAKWKDIYNPADLAICKQQTDTKDLLFITAFRFGSAIGLYNVEIFNELGLSVPQTYEEMKQAAKVIKEKKPGVYPVIFTGDAWWLDEMVLTVLAQQSDLFNDIRYGKGGRWDDPAYIKALKDFKMMYDDGVFQASTDISYNRATELFDTGQAAIFYQGTWEAARLSSKYRELRGVNLKNVGAMALPVMEKGGKATLRAFPEIGFAINKDSKYKKQAAELVFYLTGGDGFDMLNENVFGIPNKVKSSFPKTMFNSEEGKKGWDLVVSIVSKATSHRNNMSAFSNVVGAYIQKVILGQYGNDVEKACKDIQKEFESGRY